MTVEQKIEDIVKRGYSVTSNYMDFKRHRITATKKDKIIIGSVNKVHKELYGY